MTTDETSLQDRALALAARLKAAGDVDAVNVVMRLQSRLAHSDAWYSSRFDRLWHWAHADLSEAQKISYFNIVANGTASTHDIVDRIQLRSAVKARKGQLQAEMDALNAMEAVDQLDFPDDSNPVFAPPSPSPHAALGGQPPSTP